MKYLVVLTGTHIMPFPKNSLEKEVYNYLLTLDRELVDGKNLKSFRKAMTDKFSELNIKYFAQGTPFPGTWSRLYAAGQRDDIKVNLGTGRSCTLTLYETK